MTNKVPVLFWSEERGLYTVNLTPIVPSVSLLENWPDLRFAAYCGARNFGEDNPWKLVEVSTGTWLTNGRLRKIVARKGSVPKYYTQQRIAWKMLRRVNFLREKFGDDPRIPHLSDHIHRLAAEHRLGLASTNPVLP